MGFKGSSKKKKKKISPRRGYSNPELFPDFKLSPSQSSCLDGVLPSEDSRSSEIEFSCSVNEVASIDVGVSIVSTLEDGQTVYGSSIGNDTDRKGGKGGLGISITSQRAAIYRLNDDKAWILIGSGRINIEFRGIIENSTLVVYDEKDNSSLFCHCFRSDVIYSKHNDTTISWHDREDDSFEALVFQDLCCCSSIWDHIINFQNYISNRDEEISEDGKTSSDVSEDGDFEDIVIESVESSAEDLAAQALSGSCMAALGIEEGCGIALESNEPARVCGIVASEAHAPSCASGAAALAHGPTSTIDTHVILSKVDGVCPLPAGKVKQVGPVSSSLSVKTLAFPPSFAEGEMLMMHSASHVPNAPLCSANSNLDLDSPLSVHDPTHLCAFAPKQWSSLFSNKRVSQYSSQLKFFKPSISNGRIVVKPPKEVAMEGCSFWEGSLVGHFLDKRLPFPIVKSWADRLWGKDGSIEVLSMDNGFFLFKFKDALQCDKVLEAGPWFFAGKLLVLKKWQHGLNLAKEKLSSIPIWVKFFNVPLEYWTNDGLSYVASAVGKPLYFDEATEKKERINFARVCVEISVDDDIPESFDLVLRNGDLACISVEVPWSPKRCSACKCFGHTVKSCGKTIKQIWVPKSTPEGVLISPSQGILHNEKIVNSSCIDSKVVPLHPEWNTVTKKTSSAKGKEIVSSIIPVFPSLKNSFAMLDSSSDRCVTSDTNKVALLDRSSVKATSIDDSSKSKISDGAKFIDQALANLKLKPSKSCIKDSNIRLPLRIMPNSPTKSPNQKGFNVNFPMLDKG